MTFDLWGWQVEPFKFYGIDWIAFVTLIYGAWLVSCKNRWGFIVSFVGSIASGSVAYLSGAHGMVIMNVVWGTLALKSFFAYREDIP